MARRKGSLALFLACLLLAALPILAPVARAQTDNVCTGPFQSVSLPLNDLGPAEYVRMDEGPTGYSGGLYPGGSNVRPAAHEAAGVAIAQQIRPLNLQGQPDPAGHIVMISSGMSNAAMEFGAFISLVNADPDVHPQLRLINGAQPSQISTDWTDPNAPAWDRVDARLASAGLSPAQVQVAWIKNVRTGNGLFPQRAELLQGDLVQIVRALKIRYPNVKLAYLSSRTRSYTYWHGLSPEPAAFESGFSVKWLIEQQIDGDPALNYDPQSGPVVAPFLSWGPYLWIDGLNPRSDGLVWSPDDLAQDCTHPSDSGVQKVAAQLLEFFKSDSTTQPWFLDGPLPPPPTLPPPHTNARYLPLIMWEW